MSTPVGTFTSRALPPAAGRGGVFGSMEFLDLARGNFVSFSDSGTAAYIVSRLQPSGCPFTWFISASGFWCQQSEPADGVVR